MKILVESYRRTKELWRTRLKGRLNRIEKKPFQLIVLWLPLFFGTYTALLTLLWWGYGSPMFSLAKAGITTPAILYVMFLYRPALNRLREASAHAPSIPSRPRIE